MDHARLARSLKAGMKVVGSDSVAVGRVKQVRETDVLVARKLRRDLAVPFDAMREIAGERVVLAIRADRVDKMGWPSPEIIPTLAVRIPPLAGD